MSSQSVKIHSNWNFEKALQNAYFESRENWSSCWPLLTQAANLSTRMSRPSDLMQNSIQLSLVKIAEILTSHHRDEIKIPWFYSLVYIMNLSRFFS